MVGTAWHSAWLYSTDIHSAQKTPSDTVSVVVSLRVQADQICQNAL